MLDIILGILGGASVVLGFVYWILRTVFVPKDVMEIRVKAIEDAIVRKSMETLEQHNKMASKAELKELEAAFKMAIEKIDQSSRELDSKISSVQNGLYWLVAKAGGKDDVLEKLFKKD